MDTAAWSEELWLLKDAALVALFSGCIGLERERVGRPAGLRTHLVVGLSSWLLIAVGMLTSTRNTILPSVDPLRIIQAIIGGISFIGAGTIFTSGRRNRVRGLTTAATLLATASVAISVGLKVYVIAAYSTVLVLAVTVGLRWLERRLGINRHGRGRGRGRSTRSSSSSGT